MIWGIIPIFRNFYESVTDRRKDLRTDLRTDGQSDPRIEMQGRNQKKADFQWFLQKRDGSTGRPTDRRTYRPSYRDARRHLKRKTAQSRETEWGGDWEGRGGGGEGDGRTREVAKEEDERSIHQQDFHRISVFSSSPGFFFLLPDFSLTWSS